MVLGFSAEHDSASVRAHKWSFDRIFVHAPNELPERAHVTHPKGEMPVRARAKILPEIIHDLIPAMEFSARRSQRKLRVEARGEPLRIRPVESVQASFNRVLNSGGHRNVG